MQPTYSGIVAQGRDGNLYSTAAGGENGAGAVFQITPAGTEKVLYSFDGATHGSLPYGGVTLGTDGNFYGTTYAGGTTGYGTVFKITPAGSLTVLYSFMNSGDGAYPFAPPVQGTDGNLYGTTSQADVGYGTIYKITPSGKLTLLHSFDETHGYFPTAPLVQGTDGSFYGTTYGGGVSDYGVVYRITPAGKFTVIYNFDGTHGGEPLSPLVQGGDGNFYGTASIGGASGAGAVFKITAAGKLTVLHNLNGTTDGRFPYGGLVQASDGNFYGANSISGKASTGCPNGCGTTFKISPKGQFSVLHNFDLTTGDTPSVTPLQHTNGIVYGDTLIGGTGDIGCVVGDCGVFYSWNDRLPTFVALLPHSGKVGKTIEFLGQGFTGTKSVSFNGTAAKFTVSSDTYLTATVPSGATTGSVTVTTPGGKLASNKTFRVTPQIISFTPTSGSVGTSVTIKGVSLTQTKKVTFGGVAATDFTVNSDTEVTATVPTGATTGKIVIMTPGGVAVSRGVFTVTQ